MAEAARAKETLLIRVPDFTGKSAELLEYFIQQLEKCFQVGQFTNEAKASAATLKFPFDSPAYHWYEYQLETKRLENLDIWENEDAVLAEVGPPQVQAKAARPGGLRKALRDHWVHKEDLETLIRLQKQNPQRAKEEFSAWLPRVHRNTFKLEKATFPETFITGAQKANFDIVHDNNVVRELRVGANPKLQLAFEKLAVGTVGSYTEAALTWERTEEGQKWLNQADSSSSAAAKGKGTVGAIGGHRGGPKPDKTHLSCEYCGIKQSHEKVDCYKRLADETAGIKQLHCEGYPLQPKSFGKGKGKGKKTKKETPGGSGGSGGGVGSVEAQNRLNNPTTAQEGSKPKPPNTPTSQLPQHPNQLALGYQGWPGSPPTNAAIYGSHQFQSALAAYPELRSPTLRETLNNFHNSTHHGAPSGGPGPRD